MSRPLGRGLIILVVNIKRKKRREINSAKNTEQAPAVPMVLFGHIRIKSEAMLG